MAGKGNPGPPKGYKQSPEHIAKRKMWGNKNPRWKGNDISVRSGRCRAERKYPLQPCDICGANECLIDRHHRDGDTKNNAPENIQFLCRRCHMEEDGRMETVTERMGTVIQPLSIEARRNGTGRNQTAS
jgi:hypothetical protein